MDLIEISDNDWVFDNPNQSQGDYEIFDRAVDLWHESNFDLAEKLLKSLVIKSPSNIDAFHHLSMLFDESSREVEAYTCCREAVRIGMDVIPEKFNWKTSKLEWDSLDNRPFMRAYHNLGLWHQRRNEIDLAIKVFSHLFSTCPDDNLGVRYLLPKLWLVKGDYLSVIRHCKELEDDVAPEILYTHPLALILLGETAKATKLIKEAEKQLPLIAKELKKKRHPEPKSTMPGYVSHGGADQAYSYWQEYGKYWKNCTQAMELL